MALTGIHILLSYQCTHECDHCFVWSSPRAGGTFTLEGLRNLLDQAVDLGTITEIYFEGGEPFLYHPLLVEGVREARTRGFAVGIVTNCYWASTQTDAMLWLEPLADLGLSNLSVSSDAFHSGDGITDPRPSSAAAAARALGFEDLTITIDPPSMCATTDVGGRPIVGGAVRFRGRAATTLVEGLPTRPWTEFTKCPDEDFVDPGRVHVDGWGNVHLCQGVLLGSLREASLSDLVREYDPTTHPVVGPLVAGGPAELFRRNQPLPLTEAVDACHLCYTTRLALRDYMPDRLGPPQVYGLTEH